MVFNPPAKAYRTFSSKLGRAKGKTRFDRLENYFGSVRKPTDFSPVEWDFQDRLDSGKFFYYPGETKMTANNATCFENSAHLLMAAKELYPSSNPRMAYVDEGRRGTHSVVLFEHQNRLWGGDISYDFFSPVHINGRKLMYERDKKERGVKFKSLTTATPRDVAKVIENLRGPKGCTQYFVDGGQKVLENPNAFRPYSIFVSYKEGKLVSDIRFNDFGLWNNTSIRRRYDLNRDKFNVDVFIYKHEDWAHLTKARKVCWNPEPSKIGGGVMMNQFCSVGDLKGWKLDDFVKQFGSYHGTIHQMAKSKRRSKNGLYFFTPKTRREVLGNFKEDFQKYLKSLPPNFMQRYLDFATYAGSDYVVKLLSKKKEKAKSWKDVTIRGKNAYIGSFTAALREISKREAKLHRTLDHKVLKLLKEQETL